MDSRQIHFNWNNTNNSYWLITRIIKRCRYELKPKFNSCELESLFHVKQSRKMNQEVIRCAKPSTSIFLESLIKHLKRTIENNQYFGFSCCIQAGKRTYFTVPIRLCIRVMEFGLLIKFCFPIIRFRIKATKIESIFHSTINWNPMWFRLISPVWSMNFFF